MKRIFSTFLIFALILIFFTGCGNDIPTIVKSEEIIYKTVGDVELGLEIYAPTDNISILSPAVIVLHGGGWVSGSREDFTRDFEPLCNLLRANGIAVISVNYRLADKDSGWRVCLDDCIDALYYITSNSKKLGIDKDNIGMIGYSAGGQLALMTAIETADEVKYCVSMSGPTFISNDQNSIFYSPTLDYYINLIFDISDNIDMYKASPIVRLTRKCKTEFLLISGTDDMVVTTSHADSFMREITEIGSTAELMKVDGLTHSYTVWDGFEQLCSDISDRIVEHLNRK